MVNLIDALGKSFERLLRWIYPGALFLVLLYLSSPPCINVLTSINGIAGVWGLVLVAVVAGMAVYIAQAYIFNQIVSLCFSPSGLLHKKTKTLNRGKAKKLAKFADTWGEGAWRRWGIQTEQLTDRHAIERLNGWLDYAWSAYHAGCITLWLTLTFFCFSASNSILGSISPWIIWPFMGVLLVSLLWQYLILTRVVLLIPKTQ